ncbi:hypothetical protein HPB52_012769 [Rhipicephalus sanguineus]|uniref:Peptidase M13 N-terminal domain-containing protein n=1 Tax=Rhipicephalus sanguineus TaxID=34632 RepID=A0A9D4PFE1_RHISA|nr:hypothetical protein HPB52_012769 [Rhipicephalus sanguineus]
MKASSSTLHKSSPTAAVHFKTAPRTSPSASEEEVASQGKPPLSKPASNKLHTLAVFTAVAVTPFLFVVVLSIVLEIRSYFTSQPTQQFCCPNELLTVLRGVNSSIDPCDDFYQYVCSRIDAGEVQHVSPPFRVIQQLNLLEVANPGESGSAAGEMLATIKRGVWDAEQSGGEDIGDYVTAISKALRLAPEMDLLRMVRFMAELSLRYGLSTVVSFEVSEAGDILIIKINDGCISQNRNTDMLHFALESFNNVVNATVDLQGLQVVEETVIALRRSKAPKILYQPINNSPFEDLKDGDWNAIINDLVLPVHPNANTVETHQNDKVNALLDNFAYSPHQPATIAYVAVCSALSTRDLIEEAALKPGAQSLSACQVMDICEIEQAYMAHLLSGHHMNEYVAALFTKMRDNVFQHANASLGKVYQEEVSRKLQGLRLVLPEEIVASDIPVPTVAGTFADTFIAARSYVFEVRKAKVARNIPNVDDLFLPAMVRNGDVAYVPTNLYAIVQQHVQRMVVLDVPVLGVDMAYQLWSFLLEQSWPSEISRSIETYKSCFKGSRSADYLKTAYTALGVVSAVDAMMAVDWNVVGSVNGTETTVGRLVYLMQLYATPTVEVFSDDTPGVTPIFVGRDAEGNRSRPSSGNRVRWILGIGTPQRTFTKNVEEWDMPVSIFVFTAILLGLLIVLAVLILWRALSGDKDTSKTSTWEGGEEDIEGFGLAIRPFRGRRASMNETVTDAVELLIAR